MLGLVWFNVRNAASTMSQRGSLDPVLRLGFGFPLGGRVSNGLGVVTLTRAVVKERW
jgi:hypothetical protein